MSRSAQNIPCHAAGHVCTNLFYWARFQSHMIARMLGAMWAWIKRTAFELAVGAAVGFVLWSLAGKSMTSMLFGSLGGTFSCRADVELALDKFLSMQLYSALLGAVLGVVVMIVVRRRWPKTKPTQGLPNAP